MIQLETKNGIVELRALLSVTDLRKYLGTRSQTVYDLFRVLSFPSKRIVKSQFVTENDFKAYIESP